ncbi:MAG: hypothetical protein KJN60_04035 [Boseongicola sp.]|nr:hypothetical protein [Boseongicola sp.]
MIRFATISLCCLAALSACGPISPERAADQCEDRAREAAGPTGKIGFGVNSSGEVTNSFEIGISSDFLTGKEPEQVYEDCVRQKTGQAPIRPLEL